MVYFLYITITHNSILDRLSYPNTLIYSFFSIFTSIVTTTHRIKTLYILIIVIQ
jgi:hypothetical protein